MTFFFPCIPLEELELDDELPPPPPPVPPLAVPLPAADFAGGNLELMSRPLRPKAGVDPNRRGGEPRLALPASSTFFPVPGSKEPRSAIRGGFE
jgi:hypothetical protein